MARNLGGTDLSTEPKHIQLNKTLADIQQDTKPIPGIQQDTPAH